MSRRPASHAIVAAVRAELVSLRELIVGLENEILLLRERLRVSEAENTALQAQISELEARPKQNSSNSSRPPSSDPPEAPKRPAKPSSPRKRGGQPGHPGTTRLLAPPDQVDDEIPVFPELCAHCNAELGPGSEGGEPVRHQVYELPPIQLRLIEYQLHARTCPHCRHRTRAALPNGVPAAGEGFRLQALVGLLTGRHHVSRRQTQELLADLLGRSFSLGTVSTLEAKVARALNPAYREIAAAVAQAPLVNVDETSWRQGKRRPYLWTVVSPLATLFRIGSRTKETFVSLLPHRAAQIVGSDRYAAYDHLAAAQRQICWAHLIRDFQAVKERAHGSAVGNWALEVAGKLFALWHDHQAGRLDRAELQLEVAPLQDQLRAALRLGAGGHCAKTAGFCQQLLDREPALWTFLREPGVEPTNNAAERALRPAVLWRKRSSGHQSELGGQFVERFLSVSSTLRQQGRSVLDFLEATLRAAASGTSPPSVLPQTE